LGIVVFPYSYAFAGQPPAIRERVVLAGTSSRMAMDVKLRRCGAGKA